MASKDESINSLLSIALDCSLDRILIVDIKFEIIFDYIVLAIYSKIFFFVYQKFKL